MVRAQCLGPALAHVLARYPAHQARLARASYSTCELLVLSTISLQSVDMSQNVIMNEDTTYHALFVIQTDLNHC